MWNEHNTGGLQMEGERGTLGCYDFEGFDRAIGVDGVAQPWKGSSASALNERSAVFIAGEQF
jgi:hypothetical protein